MSETRLGTRLPLLAGARHLGFRCNGCGACCRGLRVALTHHDLARLSSGLGRHAASLVEWLPAELVDMTGEPGSFVELRAGRRLMVLAQRDGACHLLDAAQRCSAYALRPLDCRLFPLDLTRDDAGEVVAVSRLDPDGCGDEHGAALDLTQLSITDRRRWSELGDYQARVARWNRLARHRRRFGRSSGDPDEFLAFLGLLDARDPGGLMPVSVEAATSRAPSGG